MPWVCHVVQANCTGCGICADVCLHDALRMDRAAPYPESVAGACIGCLDCERECPFDAILMEQSDGPPEFLPRAG